MMVGDREKVDQWGLRVPAKKGEELRQALIREDALDRVLKPRQEGVDLLLPLLNWREGAEWFAFEQNPERPELLRHELIGGIAIMQERDVDGAHLILASRPSLHTVLYATSEVGGEFRTRSFEVIAGIPTTRTECIEFGHRFTIDLSAAYFSARLATERWRISSLINHGESVLDMFAGVGPFAITLADRAEFIVAADINPNAILLMLGNIAQNHSRAVLPVLADVRCLPDIIPWQFDRIIMNLPVGGEEFLPLAFRMIRKGGIIHFYALVSQESEHLKRISALGGTVVSERVVRSYSPVKWHAVYDIKVKE